MTTAADLDHGENWCGGFYELAICLGPRDDERLDAALASVWRSGKVVGCAARGERGRHDPVPLTVASLERYGHLHGVVALPGGVEIVCGVVAIRFDDGDDWLDFSLPLGALGSVMPQVGGFPFGTDGGAESRIWREPIDAWLVALGTSVYDDAPFTYAAIGFEASGLTLADLAGQDRFHPVLRPGADGLELLPVTRWDFGTPG